MRVACVLIILSGALGMCAEAQVRSSERGFDMGKVRNELRQAPRSRAAGEQAAPQREPEESMTGLIVRISISLAGIIAIIGGIAWSVRRMGKGAPRGGSSSMDVLEVLPLGANRHLAMVRVIDKVYVLGQTQTGISLLDTIEGDRAIEVISSTRDTVSLSQFKDVLHSFVRGGKKPS